MSLFTQQFSRGFHAKAAPATIKPRSGRSPRKASLSRIQVSRARCPEISDAAYDKLLSLERTSKRAPGHRHAGSPTARVEHSRAKAFKTVRQARPMLSLDNAFSFDALRDFGPRVPKAAPRRDRIHRRHKFDGLSISLLYEDQRVVAGLARRRHDGRGRNTQHKNHSLHYRCAWKKARLRKPSSGRF